MASLTPVASTDAFVETLSKSGLVTGEALAKIRAAAASASDPRVLARDLVKDGTLTKWQAGQLLHGYFVLIVGKYKLLDQLGAGEMGRVYLAEHVQMGRRHALKILSRRHTAKADVLKRFLVEAQRVCGLDHRNLSHIYDVNQDGDKYFLVMEHVEGQDLQKLVEKEGKLPILTALEYACQAAEGLAHAHKQAVVHGDLKPTNLLLDSQGVIKILDIGQARLIESPPVADVYESAEVEGLASGIYHAPEQRSAAPTVDSRGDVYSLGSVLFFLLTGNAAADGTEAEKQLLAMKKEVPGDLARLVGRMMASEPADRPESMGAVIEDLLKVPRKAAVPPPPARAKSDALKSERGEKTAAAATKAAPPPMPRAKKPPVAKRLDDDSEVVADSVIAEEPEPAKDSPFAGFSPGPKGRASASAVKKPPAKTGVPPKAKVAAAEEVPAAEQVEKKGSSRLPLILAAAGGGGVLVLVGIAALVYFLFIAGGSSSDTQVAKNDAPPPAQAPVDTSESNPESNPVAASEEANPTLPTAAAVEPPADSSAEKTAASEPAKTDDTKTADAATDDTKTTTAEPNPAAIAKTETAKTETAKPEPVKTEPPKPEPVKTAPKAKPAGNPFQGFVKAVTLPKLEPMMTNPPPEALAALVLGPCKVEPKTLVILRLNGGDGAIRGGKQKFELAAANNGTAERDWDITLTGGEAPVLVAQLSAKNDQLMFQWTPEGAKNPSAPQLINCSLDLNAGAGKHAVAFREPLTGEPLIVDLEKPADVTWNIDLLPDPKKIMVEITKLEEGFLKHKFDPKQQLEAMNDTTTVWTGNTEDALILGFKLETDTTARGVKVDSSTQIKFEGMNKPMRFTKKEMTSIKSSLDQQQNVLTKQLSSIGGGKKKLDARSEQAKGLLNSRLVEVGKAADQVTQLSSLASNLQGKGKIHFRVYYQAEEGQIDLLVTSEAAPTEDDKKDDKKAEKKADKKAAK